MTTAASELDNLLARARARRALPEPAMRRLLRVRAGLSQAEVAAVLEVDSASVSRWETGRRTPVGRLAEAYSGVLERLAAER